MSEYREQYQNHKDNDIEPPPIPDYRESFFEIAETIIDQTYQLCIS